MLTQKQHELLTYIDQRLNDTGVPPSFDEMKVALGLQSKSGIHRLIVALEDRGFIRRLPHKARAIEVLKKPQNTDLKRNDTVEFKPQLVDSSFSKRSQHSQEEMEVTTKTATSIPFYGKIAAGTPIEALRDNSRTIEVPSQLLGRGDHYALEIEGDSMIEAGIFERDVVLIKRTDTAENGQIVVALVDGHEATLKRLRRRGASIALEPANKLHETRIFGPDQVRVQGKLVGLVRNY